MDDKIYNDEFEDNYGDESGRTSRMRWWLPSLAGA